MTDDIRPAPDTADLLVVGGVTVDILEGGREAAGGAARYATQGALSAGLRVVLHTTSGDEPPVRAILDRLAVDATVALHPARASIRFEHHGADDARRLRMLSSVPPLTLPDPDRLPPSRAVLYAPVADEVAPEALRAEVAPFRGAGIQGWLRVTDSEGWVRPRAMPDLPAALVTALRDLDLVVCSRHDLDAEDGPSGVARLRAWLGPKPELAVTAGAAGAWLDDGSGQPAHVPARVVADRGSIGAGDAFAAVLVAGRGSGLDLRRAGSAAAQATADYLASRPAH